MASGGALRQGLKFGRIAATYALSRGVSAGWGERYLVRELSRRPGLGAKIGQLLAIRMGCPE
jgi:hypothetical protein